MRPLCPPPEKTAFFQENFSGAGDFQGTVLIGCASTVYMEEIHGDPFLGIRIDEEAFT